jgi:excisionase family DNA binding protein
MYSFLCDLCPVNVNKISRETIIKLKIIQMEIDFKDLFEKQNERLSNIENLLASTKNVMNLNEVCKLTGLSKSHIYKLSASHSIPCYKQSKHLFFDRKEVEEWLRSNKQTTSEETERMASSYILKGGKL